MAHDTTDKKMRLLSNRILAYNTLFNLLGQGIPVLLALGATPIIITHIGIERFGILALAWVTIGYFSLFDLGLGRAMTKLVAEKLGGEHEAEIPVLFWTGLIMMLGMGMVGTLLTLVLTPQLILTILKIPTWLQPESVQAFYLLAFSIPFVTSTAGLTGLLSAQQRFGLINLIRVPLSLAMYVGPLLVLPFSQSLVPIIALLVGSRIVAMLAYLLMCRSTLPELFASIRLQRAALGPLIRFGSWMTVSNIISPLMVTLDRFLIGAVISIAAVTYYATPYDAATRLGIITSSLIAVLFPAFSTSYAHDMHRTIRLFDRGFRYIFLVLFPLAYLIVALSHEGLQIWLGDDFARQSSVVLQLLTIGVFYNNLAQVPFGLVQAAGRPDLTAKLHLLELPFYLCALVIGLRAYSINGAAVVWTVRVALDMVLLFVIARRFLPNANAELRRISGMLAGATLLFVLAMLPFSLAVKLLMLVLVLLVFSLAVWFLILIPQERTLIQVFIQRRGKSLFSRGVYDKA